MQDWISLDKEHLWHPFDVFRNTDNIFVERSEGLYLYTSDGRTMKDMVSSWWTNLHGHNHPYIVRAIQQQAEKLSHIIFSGFTHEPAIQFAKRLLPHLPGKMEKLFLSDNGSTAVEVGIKMAIQYWFNLGKQKRKMIAFEGCYHGDTFGAMSLAGPFPFNEPFAHYLFEVIYLPFPTSENKKECFEALTNALRTNDVAAMIYEPMIQGVGGMRLFHQETLDTLLKMAKERGVLLIADEVMTGFGRTGKTFASEYLTGAEPDIVCLSKGITGGFLGMGATAATLEIFQAFDTKDKKKVFLHGHSYTGNALACASANASLDLLLQQETQDKIHQIAAWQRNAAAKMIALSKVKDVFALGTILSISLKDNISEGYFAHVAEDAYQYFLQKNILLRPMGNVLYLSPPYCISETEINEVYEVIIHYLSE